MNAPEFSASASVPILNGRERRRDNRKPVQGRATLTLARHVYLSTQFPERIPFTEALLDLCEQRLGT